MHEELAVLETDDGRSDVDADVDKCLSLGEGGGEEGCTEFKNFHSYLIRYDKKPSGGGRRGGSERV